ncbi:MAG: RimK family alpha-L-glutamate ligase [Acidimicrobiia bacterium]
MRVGMITRRHPTSRKSPIIPEVIRLLQQWGCLVDVIVPEDTSVDLKHLGPERDLHVLKSGTELALSYAGALEAGGATVVNTHRVSAALRDKIVASGVLVAAGIPVPETLVGGGFEELLPALEAGPLVIKPYRGSQGVGVTVVSEPDELRTAVDGIETLFAQRYHEPDGPDHKIYSIGGKIFGVSRPWPVRTYRDKVGTPITISSELRDLAEACGAAFGIDLFGIDVIYSGGEPFVVDMSSFPGFKGVPDAGLRLADYIYDAARGASASNTHLVPVGGGAV